ncbi:DNA-binding CsgD family transcriptional regulator [Pedobacter sp. AK013]|uniref:7TM-DISM domain-containing protein n=1 Tax=Pedobacter sp. AK013 TaxID=2723071 RepID=UPI00160C6482|nr:7TM-DISM domain-containing protein [Pedobacter sp. AK013]MBB6238358.1 DNA-binding CsgD family transcriptional regulator [Pedobacter sp. AK013]
MKTIFILIAFLIEGSLCMAQPLIQVEKQTFVNVGKAGYFWQDASGTTSFEKVEQFKAERFSKGKSAIFNGGTSGKLWWMKLSFIKNNQTTPYLYIDYANIDTIDVFYRDEQGKINQINSGMFNLKRDDNILGTGYVFPLQQVKTPIGEVYVRMRAMNTLIVPVKLVTESVLNHALFNAHSLQPIYMGIALMILIFHVFMFVVTRSKLFALYIARIILLYFIVMVCYLQGYGLLLGQPIARFILVHAHFFIALGYISTILFNSYFLKLKRQLPQLYKFFRAIMFGWSLILICSLWDARSITNMLTQILFLLTSLLFLFSSVKVIIIRGYAKNNTLIWCYVFGWIPVALTSIYLVFCLTKLIPFQPYSFNLLTLASIIEAILISLGLYGQRLRLLTRHNAHFRRQRILLQEQVEGYRKQLDAKPEKPVEHLSLKAIIELAHARDPSFMKRFSEAESIFIERLLQVSPQLLPAELTLCAYIRLNFDTKEIARTCKLSVRAVESRKYRIRKKLGIDGETNMYTWMLDLTNRPK